MKKVLILFLFLALLLPLNLAQAESLSSSLKGRILLQVEANGEAWYVNPVSEKRFYLGRPADAFRVMREQGLGISNKDYNSFKNAVPLRLAGKILLKVEDHGEAYYINPFLNGTVQGYNPPGSTGGKGFTSEADVCIGKTEVREIFCGLDGYINKGDIKCPQGTTCKDGACV